MSYETRLEGALPLEPFPEGSALQALREALSELKPGKGGRVQLTPMGHGLTVENVFDWAAAVEDLKHVLATVLAPHGIGARGSLRAVGEDEAHLANVFVDEHGVRVEHVENEEGDENEGDDDAESWIDALGDDDPELRAHAASQLAAFSDESVVQALANAAQSDEVEEVRIKALESLGEIGEDADSAVDSVAQLLVDESPFVRYWATYALGRFGSAAGVTIPQLEKLTTDLADGPRYGAVDAIRRIRAASAK